ncbi:MAG: hypothetical protein AAFY29_15805 [Pseudomonadota bacterium]
MPVQTFTQHRYVYRLAVVAILSLMTGCAERASNVSLDELARRPTSYSGHRVSTVGELRYHSPPPHFWLESASGARVEVLGLTDPALITGAELRVTGRFRYSRERGRRIDVETQEIRN